jgi:hypothetical protein
MFALCVENPDSCLIIWQPVTARRAKNKAMLELARVAALKSNPEGEQHANVALMIPLYRPDSRSSTEKKSKNS